MITINNKSREFDKKEVYKLTIAPDLMSVKDIADNETLDIAGYLEFTDTKDNGESTEILSLLLTDGSAVSTQSATFKRSIKDIETVMESDEFTIKKISGTTKAGRPFVNCVLV